MVKNKQEIPQWFDDAKFGVMVVWTPASVPAFAPKNYWDFSAENFEWIPDNLPFAELYQSVMQIEGGQTAKYHAERYGDKPYDEFVHEFRDGMSHWSPKPWADLFSQAGFKYVVPVVKHQDGFLLWPSDTPNPKKEGWQTKQDVVGELAEEVRKRGMRFGVLYSGGADSSFGGFREDEEGMPIVPQEKEYAEYVDAHWRELVEKYKPSILWNDMGYPLAADAAKLTSWYREQIPDGVINDRFGKSSLEPDEEFADFSTLEYQRDYANLAPADSKWESTRGIGSSFGYNRQEDDAHYTSSTKLIHELIDCVARGGNFLLAVGPTATGRIPWLQAKRLLEIGEWLRENGAAIYKTRTWVKATGTTEEGLEVRYTKSEDAVNAIILGTPKDSSVELDVELEEGAVVTLTSTGQQLQWIESSHGAHIELPETLDEQPAVALEISPLSAVKNK